MTYPEPAHLQTGRAGVAPGSLLCTHFCPPCSEEEQVGPCGGKQDGESEEREEASEVRARKEMKLGGPGLGAAGLVFILGKPQADQFHLLGRIPLAVVRRVQGWE